jgi:hypothetical protein
MEINKFNSMEEQTQNKKRFWRNWDLKTASKTTLMIILGFWIIFSMGYVLRDQWIKFQNQQVLTAYQQGVGDTVRALITEAQLCRPVSLLDGENRIELLKVGCPQE